MLLKIQQRLIDLNYVYSISEVKQTHSYSDSSVYYYFTISFLGDGNDLTFMVRDKKFSGFYMSEKKGHPFIRLFECYDLYEKSIEGSIVEAKANIEYAREQLIQYWNKNKSEIPEIRIKGAE